jgi:ribosome-associated protein
MPNTNILDNDSEIEELPPSKTKRKQHMDYLQNLGMELVELSKQKLAKIELPDNLIEAIKLSQKITANGATRRQSQYIGKLMRNVDAVYIENKLHELNSDSVKSTKLLHDCEMWRERLIKEDKELDIFVNTFATSDIGQLRGLIRLCRKEQAVNEIKTYRKLFKFIRDVIEMEKE